MRYLLSLLFVMSILGCSDEYSPEIGYNYDEVQQIITETSHVDTIYINTTNTDTVVVVQSKRDTVFVNTTDSIYVSSQDTLYINSRDTLVSSKIDTVVISKRDTIHVKDTILIGSIDTIYVKDSIIDEVVRDTTITLSMDVDGGSTISRKFTGKVYKGVFYDTQLYTYAVYTNKWSREISYYYLYSINALATSSNSSTNSSYYKFVDQCGGDRTLNDIWISADNYGNPISYNNFPGWRKINQNDLIVLGDYASDIISPDAKLFSSWAISKSFSSSSQIYAANTLTLYGNSVEDLTNGGKVHYMCAYDLNP